MDLLIRTSAGAVAYSELDRNHVIERMRKTQVILSDLDDTDADSPAKEIARTHFQRGEKFDFEYVPWVLSSVILRARYGKKAETRIWRSYVEKFLQTSGQRAKAQLVYQTQNLQKRCYPFAKGFYQSFPNAHKVYVTRNIEEIARTFARALRIDDVIPEAWDKAKATEQFILANPWFKRYLIKGDSEEDEDVLKVAQYYKKQGSIDDVTGIWVTPTPEKPNRRFTIHIGRDYGGIVELLQAPIKRE